MIKNSTAPLAVCAAMVVILSLASTSAALCQIPDSAATRRANEAMQINERYFQDDAVLMGFSNRGLLIAEGDSWFAYPGVNLLKELRKIGFAVESNAENGSTLEEMAYSVERLADLHYLLKRAQRSRQTPRALLLSAGGNDVVKEPLRLMLNHSSVEDATLNEDIVRGIIDVRLRRALVSWVLAVRELMRKELGASADSIPILVHGYDYPVPDGRGFRRLFVTWSGPWMQNEFLSMDRPHLKSNAEVMKELLDRYNLMLKRVADELPELRLRYVELRSTLSNNEIDYRADWENELHPSPSGFERLARKIAEALR